MADYIPKDGDRVRHKETGQMHVYKHGQWEPIEVTGGSAAGANFVDQGISNAVNTFTGAIPRAIGGAATAIPAAVESVGRAGLDLAQGNDTNLVEDFFTAKDKFSATPAAKRLLEAPLPGDYLSENIRAGIRATFGDESFEEAKQGNRDFMEQADEVFPFYSSLGRFGADAGAVMAMRTPVSNARRRAAQANVAEAEKFLSGSRRYIDEMPSTVRNKLNDFASDHLMKALQRGSNNLRSAGIKMTEAGLEGAYLAALNDGDPTTTATLSAGMQAGGSLALHLGLQPLKKNVPVWVAGMFVSHEIWKALMPGDQDFFESKDFAVQAASAALVTGAMAAASGAGRVRGEAMAKFGHFADAFTSVPRTFWTRQWEGWARERREGNLLPGQVRDLMVHNPTFFNENQLNSLGRAFMKGPENFSSEVDRLMSDSEDFRKKISLMRDNMRPPEGTEPARTGNPRRDLEQFTPTHPIQRN